MADDDTLQLLRDELERQERVQAERHQTLLDRLAEREGRTQSPADVRETMRRGYEQSAAERAATKAAKAAADDE
jgi:hypothetical protein